MSTSTGSFSSPLATAYQATVERRALRIIDDPRVAEARVRARELMAAHPLAARPGAAAGIDRVLDKWLVQLTLQTIGGDVSAPGFIWGTNLTDYHWFGRDFPGSAAAIDCPDNIYRNAGLEGAVQYQVTGQVLAGGPAQFTLQLTRHPEGDGFAINDDSMKDLGALHMLTSRDMDIAADGRFSISLDSAPAGGRRNHIQLPAGRLYLLVRDSLSDWRQVANRIDIRRTGGAALPAPMDDGAIAAATAGYLPGFVDFWLRFNDGFNGRPAVNTLVPPCGRTGAWGYAAACRFHLNDDEAMVVTVRDGDAGYFGVQVADTWMIAPSPTGHIASYNAAQAQANPDGTLTFVLAPRDPGVGNWIDSAGQSDGWLFFRWQGVPPQTGDGAGLVQSLTVVNRHSLVGALPAVAAGQRREELARRAGEWRLRVAAGAAT